jgi:ABC-type polysaccharide/polyol phosphate export permease
VASEGWAVTAVTRPRSSVWAQRSLIWNFAQRDLKSRFKGTALGWAWSLMVPLATLIIYSVVFAVVFRATPPDFGNGQAGNYTVWLMAGLVPWSFFAIAVNTSMPTLLADGPLLQKIYFPAYTPVLGSVIAILVQTLIEFAIFAVVLVVFQNVGPSWLVFPLWLAMYVVFVTSVATALSILNIHYRDLAHLTSVALQLLFFMTPVIYPITLVPEYWQGIPLRAIVQANPVSQFIEAIRSFAYGLEVPDLATWLTLAIWTGVALAVAVLVQRRWGMDIGESI